MALSFAAATAHALLDTISARVDLGSGPGLIRIYAGTMPVNADAALASNTLLAQLTCSDPASAAASNKTLTFSAITQDSSADATGTATFFRIVDSSNNTVLQGDVTVSGGGGAIEMNTTSIIVGGPIQITSASLTLA